MFHHFHGGSHIKGQGSISASDFELGLSYLNRNYNLISSDEYQKRCVSNTLGKSDVCLSFDDGLLCQYEVALPVLDKWGLKAYFFVPSSPLEGVPINLELFRYFRSAYFADVEDFYDMFFARCASQLPNEFLRAKAFCSVQKYKHEHSFYTEDDRLYRYFRDHCVSNDVFNLLMFGLMKDSVVDVTNLNSSLWMNKTRIKHLENTGHIIGLHTHTHPTVMDFHSYGEEYSEYKLNRDCLEKITGKNKIEVAAYPCGNYSKNSKTILRALGVKVAFAAKSVVSIAEDPLEQPREDHTKIMMAI